MLIMPLRTVHVHRNITHYSVTVFSSLTGRYFFVRPLGDYRSSKLQPYPTVKVGSFASWPVVTKAS